MLTNAGWIGPPTWNWRLTRIWRSTEGHFRSGKTLTIRIEGHTLGVTAGKSLGCHTQTEAFSEKSWRNHICNTAVSRILTYCSGHRGSHSLYCTILELSFHLKHTAIAVQRYPSFCSNLLRQSFQTALHDVKRGFKTVGWFKSYAMYRGLLKPRVCYVVH